MAMCLSAVGSSAKLPQINLAKNTGTLADVVGVLETQPLVDFCIEDGFYKAQKVVFTTITSVSYVSGLILSNCATGEIVAHPQYPASGLSFDSGAVCVDMDCWCATPCAEKESDDFDIDLSADVCTVATQLWNVYAKAEIGGITISIRNADYSETRTKPNAKGIWSLYQKYKQLCDDKNCVSGSRMMLDTTGRH